MRSLNAVLVGVVFIVVVTLLVQLAFLLLAVEYNALAKEYRFLDDIRGVFRYLVGIPVVFAIMFIGGYITSHIAKTKVVMHSVIAGVVALAAAIVPTLEDADLTKSGTITLLLALCATAAGGWYWRRKNTV